MCHAAGSKAQFSFTLLKLHHLLGYRDVYEKSQFIHVYIVTTHACLQTVKTLNACSVCHAAGIKVQFPFTPLKLNHIYCDTAISMEADTAHGCLHSHSSCMFADSGGKCDSK
ncbi:hypothetical protein CDAR_42271 [Caerostris darwini]|uniref:Uncharacterized protein n=1 Tax=Caerostris darwini TaxID=1538125 RepID=A0AAV4RGH9_9ARAC|nr:hypothetical protein CDAR_42271 [Caerostris darwini]